MLNIGLTGGIGSGKSTVDRFFLEHGAYIIDFDALAHFVEEPNGVAWTEIVNTFGTQILNNDKTINREKLGNIVFRHAEKLNILNGIVHPAVIDEWKRRMDAIHMKDGRAIVISDVPLLLEVGLQSLFDLIILVYISPGEQIKRVMKRNNFSRAQAEERLKAQMPIDEKIAHADLVVNNEGTLSQTKKAVEEIWKQLVEKEKEVGRRGRLFS